MKQIFDDLLQRFLVESGLGLEEFIWGTLGFCLLFSTTHLISMLITRWGDRQATGKALLFAITAHVACLMAIVGVSMKAKPSIAVGDQTVVPIRKLVVDDEDQPLIRENGELPVWDRVMPALEGEQVRSGRTEMAEPSDQLEATAAPERVGSPARRLMVDLSALASLPLGNAPIPAREGGLREIGLDLAATPSAAPLPTDEANAPSPESRPEASPTDNTPARGGRKGLGGTAEPGAETQLVRRPESSTASGGAGSGLPVLSIDTNLASSPAKPGIGPMAPRPGELGGGDAVPVRGAVAPAGEIDAAVSTSEPGVPNGEAGGNRSELRRRISRGGDETGTDIARPERASRPGPATPGRELASASPGVDLPRKGVTPGIDRPDSNPINFRNSAGVPATYQLRNLAKRREVARKYGGTEASERSVEMALQWFASIQERDGSWDGDRFGAGQVKVDEKGVDRKYAGRDSDAGLTALVVLCYLGAGYTQEEGPYAPQVEKALRWLVAQQREDGYLGGAATRYAQMYCHGIASYALAEAYGMQSDPALDTGLRSAVQKAVAYILDMQNPSDGGWRYEKGQKSDMSMFGWQLMALKSSEIAGLRIPPAARTRMVQFLKDRSRGDQNGLAGYREESPPTPSMTAEALFCKQMLGISRGNAQSREAVQYLLSNLPDRQQYDEYYWYYGTLAMYQYGGEEWNRWNDRTRDLLIAEQEVRGEFVGSWAPRGTWGRCGGRIYQTALSTLCLEVYYRFLPLYQLNGPVDVRP